MLRHPKEFSMPASPLSSTEIDTRLRSINGWQLDHGEIVRTFTFHDFCASLDFVNRVGEVAEAEGHHPDIDFRYNKVRLALVTHDAGGLTAKDFDVAEKINRLGKTS
jgi:4a-hydroxytetrahydrobiopterin dehydratase